MRNASSTIMTMILAVAGAVLNTSARAEVSGLYFDLSLGQANYRDLKKSEYDALTASTLDSFVTSGDIASWSIDSSKLDKGATAFSAATGFRVNPYLAFDIGWLSTGQSQYRATITADGNPYLGKISMSASGPTIAIMGMLPIGDKFEIRGRAGALFGRSFIDPYIHGTKDGYVGSYSVGEKSTDPFAGLSFAFYFTDQVSVYAGWQRIFKVSGDFTVGTTTSSIETDVDNVLVGITFRQ